MRWIKSCFFVDSGNDYEKHTKCITEEEKYEGKNFKPKPNANKGEQKQELWIQVCEINLCFALHSVRILSVRLKFVDVGPALSTLGFNVISWFALLESPVYFIY